MKKIMTLLTLLTISHIAFAENTEEQLNQPMTAWCDLEYKYTNKHGKLVTDKNIKHFEEVLRPAHPGFPNDIWLAHFKAITSEDGRFSFYIISQQRKSGLPDYAKVGVTIADTKLNTQIFTRGQLTVATNTAVTSEEGFTVNCMLKDTQGK